jgi:hypothetical protein
MSIKPALTSTNGSLRMAVDAALTGLGYQHSVNSSGDGILSTICTTGPQPWLAELTLFEESGVIAISVNLTNIFNPQIKPAELQELATRLNSAITFGCYLIPVGQDCVIYRTARDFPDGITPHQALAFFNQINFPLCLWRELCSKWPTTTNVKSRLEASLIRLGAHNSVTISRPTRRALLRVINATDAPDKFEAKPSPFSLMLI